MSSPSSPVRLSALPIPGLVYRSPAMCQIALQIRHAAQSRATVLITGETGTGKELVARAVHFFSARAHKRFSPINATALHPSLAEASLFGHKEGAFTDARSNALGTIRAADGSTLFLDEIGDLDITLQPKLLRFLQEGEVHVVGEAQPRKVDVRVVAATNKDLGKLMGEGRFREDLYYRLQGIEIHLPPLRERPDDIPLLAAHFLRSESRKEKRATPKISPAVLEAFQRYNWPGNVRELQSEILQMLHRLTDEPILEAYHLSAHLRPVLPELERITEILNRRSSSPAPAPSKPTLELTFPRELTMPEIWAQMERAYLLEALQRHAWNLTHTAKAIGKSLPKLRGLLKKYGLRKGRGKRVFHR